MKTEIHIGLLIQKQMKDERSLSSIILFPERTKNNEYEKQIEINVPFSCFTCFHNSKLAGYRQHIRCVF